MRIPASLLFCSVLLQAGAVSGEDPVLAELDGLLKKDLQRLPGASSITLSYADVVAAVQPSVVTILVTRTPPPPEPDDEDISPNAPPGIDLYPKQEPAAKAPPPERSNGSGVILTPQGHVLTNHHVISGAATIKVRLPGGTRDLEAVLVGSDATIDVALLKVSGNSFPAATVADSSSVRTGDVVLALGSPFGLEQTVTLGIVSATGRVVRESGDAQQDYIQTDAPINPGNSGGALVDGRGRLVGINTSGYQHADGIGFAVPINLALRVSGDLLSHGYFIRGYLGLRMTPAPREEAVRITGREDLAPAMVFAVEPGSPGDLAGLVKGDIITGLDGVSMPSLNRLRYAIAVSHPGTKGTLAYQRKGELQTVEVTFGKAPRHTGYDTVSEDELNGGFITLQDGLQIGPLSDEVRAKESIPADVKGVLVLRADQDGKPMATLAPGDIIREFNGKFVHTPQEARKVFGTASSGGLLWVRTWSKGKNIYFKLKKS